MTWNRLLADWQAYLKVMVELPYNRDRVQALGMRFAEVWNFHASPICFLIGERKDDFDYAKWRSWMPRIETELAKLTTAP